VPPSNGTLGATGELSRKTASQVTRRGKAAKTINSLRTPRMSTQSSLDTQPERTYTRKETTCHRWWLCHCPHIGEANCDYAHRLFAGRAGPEPNLSKTCNKWAVGRCRWPARLCWYAHALHPPVSHNVGVERDRCVVDADWKTVSTGFVCCYCDLYFANAEGLQRHSNIGGVMAGVRFKGL